MNFRTAFYKTFFLIKQKRAQFVYDKKIIFLLKKNKSQLLDSEHKNKIRILFSNYGFKSISLKWHQFYSDIFGENLIQFIPESIFYYKIEIALNRSIMYPALEDKNLLDLFFPKSFVPETIIKNINGYFFHEGAAVNLTDAVKACLDMKEFVIKPSIGTAGGSGVKKIDISTFANPVEDLNNLFKNYRKDFIIQKILKQHTDLSALNSTSINTIRVISYLRESDVKVLSAVVRIGRSGSFTDNMTIGGMGCGVDTQGCLKEFGYDTFAQKFITSDNGTILKGFKLPEFNSIIKNVEEKHKNLPYFKLVSWDIMVTHESQIKMIEFNALGQDINLHQMANGPLFGDYFDEIMEITKKYEPLDQLKYGK